MANRLRFNTNGMKISEPGFNVDTASAKNILFDSNEPVLTAILSGSVTLAANAAPSSTRYFDLALGRVSRPIIYGYVHIDTGTGAPLSSFIRYQLFTLFMAGYSGNTLASGNTNGDGQGAAGVSAANFNATGDAVWNYNYTEQEQVSGNPQYIQRTDRSSLRLWWTNTRPTSHVFYYRIFNASF